MTYDPNHDASQARRRHDPLLCPQIRTPVTRSIEQNVGLYVLCVWFVESTTNLDGPSQFQQTRERARW
jgi:hypothetical protein